MCEEQKQLKPTHCVSHMSEVKIRVLTFLASIFSKASYVLLHAIVQVTLHVHRQLALSHAVIVTL